MRGGGAVGVKKGRRKVRKDELFDGTSWNNETREGGKISGRTP